ncbi:MAG: hypothetical protein LBL41_00800 [Bifidobacteriaceae bacterium]|jgi:N utilization substance protein A|nr:hypothetical protein [Bifidobacteriaceae bacterium]
MEIQIEAIKKIALEKALDFRSLLKNIERLIQDSYNDYYGQGFVTGSADQLTLASAHINSETGEVTISENGIAVDRLPVGFEQALEHTLKANVMRLVHAEHSRRLFNVYNSKLGHLVSARITGIDESGMVYVQIEDSHEAVVPVSEQMPNEQYIPGEMMHFVIADVLQAGANTRITLSRSHPNIVTRIIEFYIPEVQSGEVEIVGIAREPGSRSKVSVRSNNERINPVGSVIGRHGIRMQNIIEELSGEKIDLIQYSSDILQYVANALSPARINSVEEIDKEGKLYRAYTDADQLTLAIGKGAQNVRLAVRLLQVRIDIKEG